MIKNARIATCAGPAGGDARARLGLIDEAAIVIEDDRVAFVGLQLERPEREPDARVIDAKGRLVTPGLVDPHTHLVFAGSRAAEFERKMAGVDYRTIAETLGVAVGTVGVTLNTAHAKLRELVEEAPR